MPNYEYACKDCGEHLEVVQSFKDDSLTQCPACSGRLRKVFNPIGIAFRGSGFYRTDSRRRAGAPDKPGESTGASASGTGEKSGSDAGAAAASSAPKESSAPTTSDAKSGSGPAKGTSKKSAAAAS